MNKNALLAVLLSALLLVAWTFVNAKFFPQQQAQSNQTVAESVNSTETSEVKDEANAEATFKRMAAAFTKLAKEKGIE